MYQGKVMFASEQNLDQVKGKPCTGVLVSIRL